ncbi:MAG: hypothetical protein GC162_13135 [Planctomycetes bacterium]|nr:hypothetical protein [Planctomycetota bacterium]
MNRLLIVSCLALPLVGCDTTPKNEGTSRSYRIETRDVGAGPNLGSADLVSASEKAVVGIAGVPEIQKAGDVKTIIVMDRVENKTSDPSANFQIYLARIRAALNQSGATRNLAFVETRAKAEGIKQREGIPADQSGRTRPNYALTGTFYDLPRGVSNYYLLTFQLVDLTNDIIVWEDSYEVKL